jgi:hypothetical protein
VQDLPRDQGQGVGSKQLVLTFNGSLAEEKADKRGSVGGNNLCVMNKFTMMAGVTTKVCVASRRGRRRASFQSGLSMARHHARVFFAVQLRETIAEGLMNMNIQPANSVGVCLGVADSPPFAWPQLNFADVGSCPTALALPALRAGRDQAKMLPGGPQKCTCHL